MSEKQASEGMSSHPLDASTSALSQSRLESSVSPEDSSAQRHALSDNHGVESSPVPEGPPPPYRTAWELRTASGLSRTGEASRWSISSDSTAHEPPPPFSEVDTTGLLEALSAAPTLRADVGNEPLPPRYSSIRGRTEHGPRTRGTNFWRRARAHGRRAMAMAGHYFFYSLLEPPPFDPQPVHTEEGMLDYELSDPPPYQELAGTDFTSPSPSAPIPVASAPEARRSEHPAPAAERAAQGERNMRSRVSERTHSITSRFTRVVNAVGNRIN